MIANAATNDSVLNILIPKAPPGVFAGVFGHAEQR
jgi:hypothetical protein